MNCDFCHKPIPKQSVVHLEITDQLDRLKETAKLHSRCQRHYLRAKGITLLKKVKTLSPDEFKTIKANQVSGGAR
jgi:hypothetical protein